jgi:hypothetical protein
MNFIDIKAIEVKSRIENDVACMTAGEFDDFFTKSLSDRRVISFTKFYNKTVLDKEKFNFGEFKHQWAIQGMKKYIYQYFEENFEELKQEIIDEKDILSFYNKYCRKERNEASFCCKLFHTILPNEFSPLDNPIRNHFKLQRIDFMESYQIVIKAYELFIKDNKYQIQIMRDILYKPKFKVFRAIELSDLRLIDMFYWFKTSRSKKINQLG